MLQITKPRVAGALFLLQVTRLLSVGEYDCGGKRDNQVDLGRVDLVASHLQVFERPVSSVGRAPVC